MFVSKPSWRDTASPNLLLVAGVGLLFAFCSFRAGPVLLAHIILIHVQRFAHYIRTVLVALLFTFRLIILLGLIAHIIIIHVQRLAHYIRTGLVALFSTLRFIILLALVATMSAFGVLHF